MPQYEITDINAYLKPYMKLNRPIAIDGEDDIVDNSTLLDPTVIKSKKFTANLNPTARTYKDLQLGIIEESEKISTDQLSNASTWAAALENEHFNVSNNKIMYTDLLEFNQSIN